MKTSKTMIAAAIAATFALGGVLETAPQAAASEAQGHARSLGEVRGGALAAMNAGDLQPVARVVRKRVTVYRRGPVVRKRVVVRGRAWGARRYYAPRRYYGPRRHYGPRPGISVRIR